MCWIYFSTGLSAIDEFRRLTTQPITGFKSCADGCGTFSVATMHIVCRFVLHCTVHGSVYSS